MLPIDTFLDRILSHLSWNRKEYEPLDTLYTKYDVPEEIQESVFNTLLHHNHIEQQKFIGSRIYVKITDNGYNFIKNTSYKDSDASVIRMANISTGTAESKDGQRRHFVMKTESGKYNLNKAEDFEQPRSSNYLGLTKYEAITIAFLLLSAIIAIATCTRTH